MTASKLMKNPRRQSALCKLHHSIPSLCERLEGRFVLSGFTVTNLLDAGPGSLRAAIDAANAAPGADVIEFAGGLKGNVSLTSQLGITEDLTVVGRGEDKIVLNGGGVTRVLFVS